MFQQNRALPFSIYASVREQRIVNVPILQPLLICVLEGYKQLGRRAPIICPAGSFVFLSNAANTDIRNIPADTRYYAMLIAFETADFDCLRPTGTTADTCFQGEIGPLLRQTLQQFVEWSAFAPAELWPARRREILLLLQHLGYQQFNTMMASPKLGHRLHTIIVADTSTPWDAARLSSRLSISESTLHRKLNAEGTSLQAVKDRARLGKGLHLLQTTLDPVSQIAAQCGFQSQSRFTEKFKRLFGTTPTKLRAARLGG